MSQKFDGAGAPPCLLREILVISIWSSILYQLNAVAGIQLSVVIVKLHASCSAVYCNRSSLWVGVFVCVGWVCYRDNSKCVH